MVRDETRTGRLHIAVQYWKLFPETFLCPAARRLLFWEQKYSNSRHTDSFKFQNVMAYSNVTLGTFSSVPLFSEASLAFRRFLGRFLICRTHAFAHHEPSWLKPIHHNNAVAPLQPLVCDHTSDVFMKMQIVTRFLCLCYRLARHQSRNHLHHVNTVQSMS